MDLYSCYNSYIAVYVYMINSAVPESNYFLVATRTTISRVSFDGLRYQVLVNNLVNAVAVDYDYRLAKTNMNISW